MTSVSSVKEVPAEFLPSDGMPIMQVIAMLMAAQAQGATMVRIAMQHKNDSHGVATGVDWISQEPIDGVVYVGCMPEWDDMNNAALNSMDW